METISHTVKPLNSLQISLLRLFDRGMTEEQILELRRVLVKHYSAMLREEVERVEQEKGYIPADFEQFLNLPS
jgi:hypothetical protein